MTPERARTIALKLLGHGAHVEQVAGTCCIYEPSAMGGSFFFELRASGPSWIEAVASLHEWCDAQARNEDRLRRFKLTGTRVPVEGARP